MSIAVEKRVVMERVFGASFENGAGLADMALERMNETHGRLGVSGLHLDLMLMEPNVSGADDLECFLSLYMTDTLGGIAWWVDWTLFAIREKNAKAADVATKLYEWGRSIRAETALLFPLYLEAIEEQLQWDLLCSGVRKEDVSFDKTVELLRAYRAFTRKCCDTVSAIFPQIERWMLYSIP